MTGSLPIILVVRMMSLNGENTVSKEFTQRWINEMNKMPINEIYGYSWGDPEREDDPLGNYLKIKDEFIVPNIKGNVVLEIGSLDGKWTQYCLEAKEIICVDLHEGGFSRLHKRWPDAPIRTYLTKGDELKGIKDNSVDFLFTLDSLMRADKGVILSYMEEAQRVIKPSGTMCFHLPCNSQPDSVRRGFTSLSLEEIEEYCRLVDITHYSIDFSTVQHGILLRT